MIVSCTQCQMKFKVDDGKIGPRGVKVRCIRCQTMIIVKPPDPLRDTQPDIPDTLPQEGGFQTVQQEAPTRVHQLDPAARAALEQAANRAEMQAVGGSFGLDDLQSSDTLPPLPAFQPEPPIDRLEAAAPPPLPGGPPPLKKAPAPAAAPNDLFANPFGGVDIGGGEGPTLELDSIGGPSSPAAAPAQVDALSDLPRFDESDDLLSMGGTMGMDGTVTKPVSVKKLEDEAANSMSLVSDASQALFSPPAPVVPVAPAPAPKVAKSAKNRMVRVGQVMIAAFIVTGYAGLYLLWKAGGIDALLPRADVVRSGALTVQTVALTPFISADGTTFWIVRGEVQNSGSSALEPRITVTLEGHAAVSVPLNSEPDAVKLYTRGEVAQTKDPVAIQPDQRLPFTAVIVATGASIPAVALSVN